MLVVSLILGGCTTKKPVSQKSFYNIDSLVDAQIEVLKNRELVKEVAIAGKQEEARFTPDSLQWANEFQIFRQIGQVNKPSFRDQYIVSDARDTNSNLTVREIRSHGDAPVSLLKVYFLRKIGDVRKIEAFMVDNNPIITNTKKLTLEFERSHILNRYHIEQTVVMRDSVNFTIAGTIE